MSDLSPWPTSPAALKRATAALRFAVERSTNDSDPFEYDATDERLQRIGGAAAAMVEQYAPGAPTALKDEAVIRFAGYLAQAGFGTMSEQTVGPLQSSFPTNHAPMFRHSGAAALIARWRVRRAGGIG